MTRRFSTADLENLTTEEWGTMLAKPLITPQFITRNQGKTLYAEHMRERHAALTEVVRVRTGIEKLISHLAGVAAAHLDGRALDLATELDHILNGEPIDG